MMQGIKIKLKDGVILKEINEPLMIVLRCACICYRRYKVTPTITSGADGQHKKNSLHYKGLAWDFRIWGVSDPGALARRLRLMLKSIDECFDVVYGDPAHRDHIHIEYDTKKRG